MVLEALTYEYVASLCLIDLSLCTLLKINLLTIKLFELLCSSCGRHVQGHFSESKTVSQFSIYFLGLSIVIALSMLTWVQTNDPDDDRVLKKVAVVHSCPTRTAGRVSMTVLMQQKTFVRIGKLATREIH